MDKFLFRLFRNNETKVHELSYLFWECTTRCNLHCRHCGSDCFAVSRNSDMPLEDFLRALDSIPRKEIPKNFTVVLTGGEPTLRPDLDRVGQELRARHIGWGMVSNGYFYDEGKHRQLMKAGMGALTISLDGLEESHDWMRGRPGSFSRALGAIRLASGEKRLAFDVVTCVNKRSLKELDALYELLSSVGVPQWRIFTIIPIGRAADDPEMHLSDEEFLYLMNFIASKRGNRDGRGMKVTFSCEGYLGPYDSTVRDLPFFCRAGVNIASVLIDGRICACPNNDRDRFSQGSIYEDDFYDVWQNRFKEYRDRSWARKGICEKCGNWRNCLGNGIHNWQGDCSSVLNCHYGKISRALRQQASRQS